MLQSTLVPEPFHGGCPTHFTTFLFCGGSWCGTHKHIRLHAANCMCNWLCATTDLTCCATSHVIVTGVTAINHSTMHHAADLLTHFHHGGANQLLVLLVLFAMCCNYTKLNNECWAKQTRSYIRMQQYAPERVSTT